LRTSRARLLLAATVLLLAGCRPATVAEVALLPGQQATFAPLPSIAPSATLPPTATVEPTAMPTATPAAPARLIASYPIDGDGALLPDRPLVLVFDRPMDRPTVEAGLVISPTVTGHYAWVDDQRVAFTPQDGWTACDAWEVRLGAEMRAADGGSLEPEVKLRFSVSGRGVPIPVLMYHHVEDLGPEATEGKKDWTVSTAAFQEQMTYLEENGWTSISDAALAAYLLDGEPLPPKAVVISVDDGNRSFYEHGWPIMQQTHLRPVMFLVAQFADYSGYVNWDQARSLVAGGAWIGSHGYSHRSLHDVPDAELPLELGESRTTLDAQLGVTVTSFCFPYGARPERALAMMAEQGYRTGYSLNPTYWQRPEEPYFIGRLRVDYRTTIEDFAALLPG